MNQVQFLKRDNAPDLAYVKSENNQNTRALTVVFLGGFRSDMMGTKAVFLENLCAREGLNFVRFDYAGHGQSGGEFEEGCISDWTKDAADILEATVSGPVILVGSSMGGWISLLLARDHSARIQGLIGLAAAPDFTKIMSARMNDEQRGLLESQGYFALDNEYSDEPYIITKKLIDDGLENALLDGDIDVACTIRLIQGKRDTDVAWETAGQIEDKLISDDVQVILLEEADHRLSAPDELAVLEKTLMDLVKS